MPNRPVLPSFGLQNSIGTQEWNRIATLNADLTALTIGGALTVTGAQTLTGATTFDGATEFNSTVQADGNVTLTDDILLGLGTGNTARFSWDTTDANANALLLQMPAAGAVDVPVLAIGQSIESVDLGLYNSVVDPRIAMFGVGAVTTGPVIEFRKARGTVAAPTVVTAGDDLGTIAFYSAVAAGEYVLGATIRADSAGSPATTRGAANLSFNVATDAAPSVFTERLLITGGGQINLTPLTDVTVADGTGLIVGHTAQVTVNTELSEVQVLGTAAVDASVLIGAWNATDTVAPALRFVKSGNAAIGSFTTVASGENNGNIQWFADDGTDYAQETARIQVSISGTVAGNRTPSEISFWTSTDAAPSVLTERWTIENTGFLVPVGAMEIGLTGVRVAQSYHTSITSTNAVTVDSSETVKSDITPYDGDALGVIEDMDIITFKHDEWLDPSGETKLGIRAESVSEPLAIRMIDRPDHEQYPGVNMYSLTSLLAKAVQQLSAKVDRIQAAMV